MTEVRTLNAQHVDAISAVWCRRSRVLIPFTPQRKKPTSALTCQNKQTNPLKAAAAGDSLRGGETTSVPVYCCGQEVCAAPVAAAMRRGGATLQLASGRCSVRWAATALALGMENRPGGLASFERMINLWKVIIRCLSEERK